MCVPGVLPEEREEMEMLERVLQRALRVRCRSGALKDPANQGTGDGDVGSDQAKSDVSAGQMASKPACKPSADQTASRRSASAPRPLKEVAGKLGHGAGPGRGGVARASARNRTVVPGRALRPRRPGTGRQPAPAPAPGGHHHPQALVAEPQQRVPVRGLCAEDSGTASDSWQHPAEDPAPVRTSVGTGAGDGGGTGGLSTTKVDG